jgi:methylated-DNA-protein-cysteine methyltransferase-like protein
MASIEKRVISRAYNKIFTVIRAIPRGRVMTYGQVAKAAGLGRAARAVGTALRAHGSSLPWQRVLGQRRPGLASISIKDPVGAAMQKKLLLKEGVRFRDDDTVELEWFGWRPRGRARSSMIGRAR